MSSSLNRSSFFKPLIGDFLTQLSIPVEFARRHEELLPGKVCLETESQESWTVKIEQGNQLEEGDFLVFDFVGRSTFKVAIFSMDGCDKCYPSSYVDGIQEPGIDCKTQNSVVFFMECGSGASCEKTNEIPKFSLQLRRYSSYHVFFPAAFAAKTGLRRKSKITLQDPRGRKWPITIFARERPQRVQTSNGWNEFVAAQKLFVGSIISIESIPGSDDDLFHVKVLKNRGKGQLLRAANKNLGRPQARRHL
ncbi:UNVERIFIED_CONTAM: hypothetical protein Slati_0036900 [Sesamum latifolium]|uniref:TF-B3 domain-containing protein n=1 Tax=Sesamum latifolium TaxID=2727402 RepID=A0AAW2Y6Q4_9LAMI